MNSFEDFILSDAFFPVLVVLLILLVVVFIWIVISNKKRFAPLKQAQFNKVSYNTYNYDEPLSEAYQINEDELYDLLDNNEMEIPELKENIEVNKIEENVDNLNDLPKIKEESKIDLPLPEPKKSEEEKTYEFPDFSSIEEQTKKETHENSDIENDIINAANKYIESIMSHK